MEKEQNNGMTRLNLKVNIYMIENGKGKEYDENGQLILEGEYVKRKRK